MTLMAAYLKSDHRSHAIVPFKHQINEYREWIYSLVFSALSELEVENTKILTGLFS